MALRYLYSFSFADSESRWFPCLSFLLLLGTWPRQHEGKKWCRVQGQLLISHLIAPGEPRGCAKKEGVSNCQAHSHAYYQWLSMSGGANAPILEMRKLRLEQWSHLLPVKQPMRDISKITAQVDQMLNQPICPQHLSAFKEEPWVWRLLCCKEDSDNGTGLESEIQEVVQNPPQDFETGNYLGLNSEETQSRQKQTDTVTNMKCQLLHIACKVLPHPAPGVLSCLLSLSLASLLSDRSSPTPQMSCPVQRAEKWCHFCLWSPLHFPVGPAHHSHFSSWSLLIFANLPPSILETFPLSVCWAQYTSPPLTTLQATNG